MRFLKRFRIGDGTFEPDLRAQLEAEGIVAIEEGLSGRVRYEHFKMPGRRHHGKVSAERLALAVTEERFAVYCRSGVAELIDSPFTNPRWAMVEIALEGADGIAIVIDYDRAGLEKVAGKIRIEAETPSAANVVEQVNSRIAAARAQNAGSAT